jgi:hypothetical protein
LQERRIKRKRQLFYNIQDLFILNFNVRKIVICLETLDTILSIWAFHLASVLNVTPRCLCDSIVEIILSSNVKRKKIYLVYIMTIFEDASEDWDNCGSVNASKLERLQLEAARIVTGLPVYKRNRFALWL